MVKFDWSRVAAVGDSTMIRIPVKVFSDSDFPFKEGQEVLVKISGKKLSIEGMEEKTE